MNTLSLAGESPVRTLLCSRVQQPRKPDKRNRESAAIIEGHDEFNVRAPDSVCTGHDFKGRSAHSMPPSGRAYQSDGSEPKLGRTLGGLDMDVSRL